MVNSSNKEEIKKIWNTKNIGLNSHKWYSKKNVDFFLKSRCDIILKDESFYEKISSVKEITIAAFTNYYRYHIYNIIKSLESKINDLLIKNKNMCDVSVDLIITGGDGYNHILNNKNDRIVSPDIDVKLIINSYSANKINVNSNNNRKSSKKDIDLFEIQLLTVRNILDKEIYKICENKWNHEKENNIEVFSNDINKMYKDLYEYCKLIMNKKKIPLLNDYGTTKKIPSNYEMFPLFKKRMIQINSGHDESIFKIKNTKMKSLITELMNTPYIVSDVLLYSIDILFENYSSYNSLAGILDIVISLPNHMGYINRDEWNISKKFNNKEVKIISLEHYIKKEIINLIKYGLRTKIDKVNKDVKRLQILKKQTDINTITILKKNEEEIKCITELIIKKNHQTGGNYNNNLEYNKDKGVFDKFITWININYPIHYEVSFLYIYKGKFDSIANNLFIHFWNLKRDIKKKCKSQITYCNNHDKTIKYGGEVIEQYNKYVNTISISKVLYYIVTDNNPIFDNYNMKDVANVISYKVSKNKNIKINTDYENLIKEEIADEPYKLDEIFYSGATKRYNYLNSSCKKEEIICKKLYEHITESSYNIKYLYYFYHSNNIFELKSKNKEIILKEIAIFLINTYFHNFRLSNKSSYKYKLYNEIHKISL